MDRRLRLVPAVATVLGLVLLLVWHSLGAHEGAREESHPETKYECRWADTPIVIDGKADDAAWEQAMVMDSFRLPWLGKEA